MADKAMDTYLNDHLSGATFGSDLARQIADRTAGSARAPRLNAIAEQVEADRQTLLELMDRLGTAKNPIKQATTWVAEKVSRVKFAGLSSGEEEFGLFMSLETMSLGVEGKASLWRALRDVADRYPQLSEPELDQLIARAESQRLTLEEERIAVGREAFAVK